MSGSINKAILIGHLGADPETVQLDSDRIACRLTIATNRQWKDRVTGERKQDVQWHRVVVFEQNAASFARNYLNRGSLVYLEGQVRTRSWEDGTGERRFTTEVVLSGYNSVLIGLAQPGESQREPQPISEAGSQPDDILWSSNGLIDVPF